MTSRLQIIPAVLFIAFQVVMRVGEANAQMRLPAQYRSELGVVRTNLDWSPKETAIVVCDMWDRHWCEGATRRVADMAPRMNETIEAAREQGVLIIHCPSGTLDHYKGTPQRALAMNAPPVAPVVPLKNWCHLDPEREGRLPIDDSDGGCDDTPRCASGSPWTRQIDTIEIHPEDAITDSAEAYYLMEQRGIKNVIVMGVHVNMCVLGRPFSIRQMINQKKNVVLVRDLTDAMYNSRMSPNVPHHRGTELVIEHIERHWCPTITSVALAGGQPFRFADDERPRVLFMIGEREYRTAETLPAFAREELEPRGISCAFAQVNPEDPNDFPGLDGLSKADLLVISVRRRAPEGAQLDRIREHLEAGKPLVGIRTASHAFEIRGSPEAGWPAFDTEVFGGDYQGHYGNKPPEGGATLVGAVEGAAGHEVLAGWPDEPVAMKSHLYKNRDLAETTRVLLVGRIEGRAVEEPVAWVNTKGGRKVFYTSLGSPEDFAEPAFRRLLVNGIEWALASAGN